MSEQFTFQELCPFNWNESVFLKNQKNHDFTMSDVSKNDLNQKFFAQENQNEWNLQQFNKKADRKLKNRANVKSFRQRKKIQQDKLQKRMNHLEAQNRMLRMERFCRKCNKPFQGNTQITQIQEKDEKQSQRQMNLQSCPQQGKDGFQFQKPIFFRQRLNQKSNVNGRIWIALGILMLVIGIHLYGFKGKQGYQDISISKIQSKKWIDIYQRKAKGLDEYFNVKVRVKSQQNKKESQKQKQIFKQIRLFHQEQNHQQSNEYQQVNRKTLEKLDMIEQKKQKQFRQMDLQHASQNQFRINKELLYAIQAEIEDVGIYL